MGRSSGCTLQLVHVENEGHRRHRRGDLHAPDPNSRVAGELPDPPACRVVVGRTTSRSSRSAMAMSWASRGWRATSGEIDRRCGRETHRIEGHQRSGETSVPDPKNWRNPRHWRFSWREGISVETVRRPPRLLARALKVVLALVIACVALMAGVITRRSGARSDAALLGNRAVLPSSLLLDLEDHTLGRDGRVSRRRTFAITTPKRWRHKPEISAALIASSAVRTAPLTELAPRSYGRAKGVPWKRGPGPAPVEARASLLFPELLDGRSGPRLRRRRPGCLGSWLGLAVSWWHP